MITQKHMNLQKSECELLLDTQHPSFLPRNLGIRLIVLLIYWLFSKIKRSLFFFSISNLEVPAVNQQKIWGLFYCLPSTRPCFSCRKSKLRTDRNSPFLSEYSSSKLSQGWFQKTPLVSWRFPSSFLSLPSSKGPQWKHLSGCLMETLLHVTVCLSQLCHLLVFQSTRNLNKQLASWTCLPQGK